jgi:hypothetical protein
MAQVSVGMIYRQLLDLEKHTKGREKETDTKIAELERNVDLLVEGQGALANRTPPKVPPFPKALERLGLKPPTGR